MMTRYLGMAAIAVVLGVGGLGGGPANAQGTYPDVERQREQHEKNVEQRQKRRAEHQERQKAQHEREEQKLERHEQKVKRKNELNTEGATEKPPPHQ